jgi:hypothetical protein
MIENSLQISRPLRLFDIQPLPFHNGHSSNHFSYLCSYTYPADQSLPISYIPSLPVTPLIIPGQIRKLATDKAQRISKKLLQLSITPEHPSPTNTRKWQYLAPPSLTCIAQVVFKFIRTRIMMAVMATAAMDKG